MKPRLPCYSRLAHHIRPTRPEEEKETPGRPFPRFFFYFHGNYIKSVLNVRIRVNRFFAHSFIVQQFFRRVDGGRGMIQEYETIGKYSRRALRPPWTISDDVFNPLWEEK